ncbi:MAG: DUF1428 domain-containing protein [Roseovarius sp.]|uniref:DUF1428 domain-containing protein n=1 Tax=Roseovarius sp. TaxID=1486281 RepID=UPI0032ED3F9F
MTYYTASVAAVPTANKQAYIDHCAEAWTLFKPHGALRMIETWGADVPKGMNTDFHDAVQAKEDETVVFAWIEWPDKAAAEAGWEKIMSDPAMASMSEMPFDGSRMIYGGFEPVYERGKLTDAGYYQGFVLAVPEKNRQAYAEMADEGWQMFEQFGATGMVENWGDFVPEGKVTDFFRATKAEKGEMPLFSWITWPDRATCDAATKKMQEQMSDFDMSKMPFDASRMMYAGFEPLFDSAEIARAA